MMKKNIYVVLFVLLYFLFPISLKAKTNTLVHFKESLDSIFDALQTKNYNDIKSLFAFNAKIVNFPSGQNDVIIPQLLNVLPTPSAYVLNNVEIEDNNTLIKVDYVVNKKKMTGSFIFGKDHKIIYCDIVSDDKSFSKKLSTIKAVPNGFRTNFLMDSKLIYVKAILNGKEELFLLDSGYSDMILNSDKMDKRDLNFSNSSLYGVGGKGHPVETTRINIFNWGGRIKKCNCEVKAAPLSYLSKDSIQLAGIIGYDMIKNSQLTFDYSKYILKVDFHKDSDKEISENGNLVMKIPFKLKGHLPVFPVEIEGKTYNMGLDTGATTNLMSSKYLSNLNSSLYDMGENKVKGFNGVIHLKKGKISETKIGNISFNDMNYSFNSEVSKQYNVDGVLGYEFLKKYITVVDYKSNEIRLYEGK
ncbi:hypothetical protein CHRY9293_03028 [Chryseobacterium potabilaquae]|uniref:Aspartyl protease n=2 Tax=Chryseobacterium potabilaquae TaxID=2675057 RepID=A0A6N4XE92_9FLAO|nr:hypothetical protein CHRY9293_03028 [Chryseobacterium potabilaquae]